MTAVSTSDIHMETVVVPRPDSSSRPMEAYLARPAGSGSFPGVVVIHEIFGLNNNIRDITRRFAREGYIALAIDLFSGSNRALCLMRAFYGMLVRPLDNGMVAELQGTLHYLRHVPGVDGKRVGVIGFCMGGGYALQLACKQDGDLKAASVFYGINPRPLEAVARACPIVGSYPEKDFTAPAAQKLEPMLTRYNIPHDIKIYPNAQHAFFNDQRKAYDAQAAADSWRRTLAFFEQHLAENLA